ncbi:MAG: cytochrome c family protein [Sphingomonas fennica]
MPIRRTMPLTFIALALAACKPAPTISEAAARAARLEAYRGDPGRGQTLFAACRTCHSDVAGGNRTGPSLFAVVGRPAGTVPGFHYSPANRASRLVWDAPTLFRYLLDPQATVPGTFMSYGGMADPQARADVIAYLATRR